MATSHDTLNYTYQEYAKRLTKAAAIACFDWIGLGDEKAADQAAVNAMRNEFDHLSISGRVVIGEGERDEAPMLYIGEEVGLGGDEIDIAVDPLEGTTICASNMPNSIAVLALAKRGGLLHAPDVYMDKIAVGPGLPKDVVSLDNSVSENIKNLAKAKKCSSIDLNVCVLKRERHAELIAKIREAGARVQLIGDGDVSAVIATSIFGGKVDLYMGSGGAPEGVLAAAALSCIGGQMQGKLLFRNQEEKARAAASGIEDLNKVYNIQDMVKSDVIFCATGVTGGWMLEGVEKCASTLKTSHLIMHKATSSMKFISETDFL
ncbi:MAG: ywjI [Candidatus Midichloriaceae bacterium]|jgi:fructose-1,6-bisphosphatase II / sedoheptulose-1,7-bisphosphatase|nr:ywjI [Candidatus Midichloriaceae bacterium]